MRACSRCNEGISARQGSHQVAQKLTATTVPLSCCRSTVWPERSGSTSAGVGLPSQRLIGASGESAPNATAAARAAVAAMQCVSRTLHDLLRGDRVLEVVGIEAV